MSSFHTFAKTRALNRLFDRGVPDLAPEMYNALRSIVRGEMSHGWETFEDLTHIGHYAADELIARHGIERLQRKK